MFPVMVVPAALVVPATLITSPDWDPALKGVPEIVTPAGCVNTVALPLAELVGFPGQPVNGIVPDSAVPVCARTRLTLQGTLTLPVASGTRMLPPVHVPAR